MSRFEVNPHNGIAASADRLARAAQIVLDISRELWGTADDPFRDMRLDAAAFGAGETVGADMTGARADARRAAADLHCAYAAALDEAVAATDRQATTLVGDGNWLRGVALGQNAQNAQADLLVDRCHHR